MRLKMKTTNKSILKSILLILFIIGLSATLSFAQDHGQTLSASNLKIFVQYKLAQAHLLNNDNIKVEVNGNNIILSGEVPTLNDKNQAEVEAQSVDENYMVENNLKVEIPNIPDSELTQTIMDKIQSNLFYTIFDWLSVSSDNGVVTLKGWVHLPWLKSQFQSEIEKIPGVKSVNNEMQNTFGPEDFGIRIARLIYNNPMFHGLQYIKNPPIHIIVNNGRVILEGYVKSQVQKDVAENLVKYRTDAFSVENNLKIIS
jgi:osmotically-inducible protein OsmY